MPPQHRVEAWGDVAGEDDQPVAAWGWLERLGDLGLPGFHSQADEGWGWLLAEAVEVTDLPAVWMRDPELGRDLLVGHAFPEE